MLLLLIKPLRLHDPGFESWHSKVIFSLPRNVQKGLVHTQPPIQWVTWFFPEVKESTALYLCSPHVPSWRGQGQPHQTALRVNVLIIWPMKLTHAASLWLVPKMSRLWFRPGHRKCLLFRIIPSFLLINSEICALLGCYAAQIGSYLPTFRDNPSVPFLKVMQSKKNWTARLLKMGAMGCPEISVNNDNSTLRNIPEEPRSHLHRGGSLKSRKFRDNT